MKKIILISTLLLILFTSLVKNSTKKIEDKIYTMNENIGSLKIKLGNEILEYNYLSSPDKLTQYQLQFFKDDFIRVDILKIKKISEKNNIIQISDFVKSKINE